MFPAPVFGWGRYETYEFGCTVAFHDQSNGGYSYVITMLLFVLGIPLCKNWNWNYDYCQFILNVFETSKIKRLKLVFFPFLTHAFLCVSSSKQLLLCLVLHKCRLFFISNYLINIVFIKSPIYKMSVILYSIRMSNKYYYLYLD